MSALSTPTLEFTSRDFDTNVQALIESARRSLPGQWTSFQDGDFGQALLELIAYDTSILAFVQDQQTKERFLTTVEQYESAILFARQQGYRVRWGSPATVDVWAEIAQGNSNSGILRIRNGTVITQSNGLLWEVVGNYEIPPGRRTPSKSVTSWGQIAVEGEPAYIRILPGMSQATLVDVFGNRLPDTVSFEGRGIGPGHILILTGVLSNGVIGPPPSVSSREFAVVDVGSYRTDLASGGVLFLDRPWLEDTPFIGSFIIESRSISLVQGQTHEEVFQVGVSDRENYVISCSFPGLSSVVLDPVTPALANALQTSDSVQVTVNGQLWRETPSLSLEGPNAKVYETFVDGQQRLNLRFGDGVHGVILAPNSGVAVKYRTSDGASGNVKRGAFSASIDSTQSIQLSNPYSIGNGGRERESLEELKAAILRSTRSNDRAVSAEDYRSLALSFRSRQFGSISAVKVERVSGVARNNVVKVSVWTRGETGQLVAPSVGLMGDLRTYLTDRSIITDEVIVVAGRTFTIPIAVRYKFTGVSSQDAYDGVRSAINTIFRNQTPGTELHLGDLYDAVESLEFIVNCSFYHPATSLPPVSGAYVNSLSPHSRTLLLTNAARASLNLSVSYPQYFQPHGLVSLFELNKLSGTSVVESISGSAVRLRFDTPTEADYDLDFTTVINSDYWAEGWESDVPVDLFIRIDSGNQSDDVKEMVSRRLRDWFRWFVLPGQTLLLSDIEKVIGSTPNVLSATVNIGNPTSTADHVLASATEKPVLAAINYL